MEKLVQLLLMGMINVCVAMILAVPAMVCWDYVMPTMFHLQEITYGQMLCLMAVCNILFKSEVSVSKSK